MKALQNIHSGNGSSSSGASNADGSSNDSTDNRMEDDEDEDEDEEEEEEEDDGDDGAAGTQHDAAEKISGSTNRNSNGTGTGEERQEGQEGQEHSATGRSADHRPPVERDKDACRLRRWREDHHERPEVPGGAAVELLSRGEVLVPVGPAVGAQPLVSRTVEPQIDYLVGD
ncbi:hypothetical protein PMKS-001297 [Pichia membranifaciens]|uniref:Uncharacterized protein n=1 Tax=Pichia membranifaciens TaxID=4926 RepID=A0A1Q2YE59_9ASCO|nr:hypothetical protein PMKS-001297 [Pichia membranifaciens]